MVKDNTRPRTNAHAHMHHQLVRYIPRCLYVLVLCFPTLFFLFDVPFGVLFFFESPDLPPPPTRIPNPRSHFQPTVTRRLLSRWVLCSNERKSWWISELSKHVHWKRKKSWSSWHFEISWWYVMCRPNCRTEPKDVSFWPCRKAKHFNY